METESGRDGDSKNLIHSSVNNNSPKHLDEERERMERKRESGEDAHIKGRIKTVKSLMKE